MSAFLQVHLTELVKILTQLFCTVMCFDFRFCFNYSRVLSLAHIPPLWVQPYPFWTYTLDFQLFIPVFKACAFRLPIPHLWGRRDEQDIPLCSRVSGEITS